MPATKFIAFITATAGGRLTLPSVLAPRRSPCSPGTAGLEKEVGRRSLPVTCSDGSGISLRFIGSSPAKLCWTPREPGRPDARSKKEEPHPSRPRAPSNATHHGCAVPQARPTSGKVTTACLEPTTN